MKIAIVVTGLKTGGAERQVCDLADALARKGHSVRVISLTAGAELMPSDPSVEVREISASKAWGAAKIVFGLKRCLDEFSPDVIHSHLAHAIILTRVLRPWIKSPVLVCTAHSTNENGWYWKWLYRLTDRFCDLTTNVSHAGVRAFVDKGAVLSGRIRCIYNGLDTARFTYNRAAREKIRASLGLSESQVLVVNIARFTPAKDHCTLIKAFDEFCLQNLDAHLAMVGSGELKDFVQSVRDQSENSLRIHVIPPTAAVADWLSAADVFMLSSRWEGFGLVLAEAMLVGCPLVSTRVGGTDEVVGDIWPMCDPGEPRQLAMALQSVVDLAQSEKSARVAAARNRISSLFSMNAISEEWINTYYSLYRYAK